MDIQDLPTHDFENDKTISQKRKEACRLNYEEMELHHIDKIYTSAYVYDKTTGEPIAKKPKSLHEIVFFLIQTVEELDRRIHELGG